MMKDDNMTDTLGNIVDRVKKHKGPLFVSFDGRDYEGTVRVYKSDLIVELKRSGSLDAKSEFYVSTAKGNMFVFREN